MTRATAGRVARSTALVVVVHVVLALLWAAAVPRVELVSAGDGTGTPFPESGAASSAQLLAAVPLLAAAAVCTTLVLWRRYPRLRRPAGIGVLAGWSALGVALTAAVLGPVCGLLLAPDPATPAGAVVALSPDLGALYFGPVLAGVVGPSWGLLPGSVGWAVLAAAVSCLTAAWLAWFSRCCPPTPTEAPTAPAGESRTVAAVPRTGR